MGLGTLIASGSLPTELAVVDLTSLPSGYAALVLYVDGAGHNNDSSRKLQLRVSIETLQGSS